MAKPSDLDGNAPDQSPVVLVLIDVINDLEFPKGEKLKKHALPAARRLCALKRRASAAGVPVIYVNDNFGRWRSDFREQVRHCRDDDVRGVEMTRLLVPAETDYFVLKPKHSGFFSTTLDLLLEHLGARTLILAGFATDICVLYTANDAFMRGFELVIASDCVASETKRANAHALRQMRHHLKADIKESRRIRFRKVR